MTSWPVELPVCIYGELIKEPRIVNTILSFVYLSSVGQSDDMRRQLVLRSVLTGCD